MPEAGSSLNSVLPQSYYHRNGDRIETLRQCIRDARLAGRDPDALPAERHLHRIVASAGLEFLRHIKSRRGTSARRAERLVNDAIRQLENIRLGPALQTNEVSVAGGVSQRSS
jgi:hypothetical protein